MKLKLYKGDIELPNDLNVEERKALVEKIVAENPESFALTGHATADSKVTVRLDIMGTYILNAVQDKPEIMSRYKEKRRPHQERAFSNMFTNAKDELMNSLFSISGESY